MSTRATIAFRRDDGRFEAVYLHFDGYPEHTGVILDQHYADSELARSLVAGGDLCGFDDQTHQPEHYGDGQPPAVMPTMPALLDFARKCAAAYLYVFEDGRWQMQKV